MLDLNHRIFRPIAVIRALTGCQSFPRYAVVIVMSTIKLIYAGLGVRTLAVLIDYVVLGTVAALPMMGRQAVVSPEEFGWEHFAWVVGLSWAYFAISESSSWQGTLGKRLLGLRVTDLNGARIGFGRANVRHLSKLLLYPIWFG
ncbi:MAG TPA: RDD family protein, partial [Burkholderiales bacterium]|nr:RDD family protein [Burkholderiales bacterium]